MIIDYVYVRQIWLVYLAVDEIQQSQPVAASQKNSFLVTGQERYNGQSHYPGHLTEILSWHTFNKWVPLFFLLDSLNLLSSEIAFNSKLLPNLPCSLAFQSYRHHLGKSNWEIS